MKPIRVIQWTTGKVGRHSLRAILEDPRLELVGLFAHSPEKTGQDAGELIGLPPCGVRASNDVDSLLSLNADAVVYTPFEANLAHAVSLLEAGVNIISTNLFANVGGMQDPQTRAQIERACKIGNSSLLITGVNPGWVNSVAVLTTAVCRRVEQITINESADCSGYQSPETWIGNGMSLPQGDENTFENTKRSLLPFKDTIYRMAEALSISLDSVDFYAEHAVTSETVDLGWFRMEQGTIGALRAGWNGVSQGKVVLRTRVAWYLTRKLDCDWVFDDDHYHIVVEGDPGVDTRIRFSAPDYWQQAGWGILTGLPAVSNIPNVVAAAPGILSLRDSSLPDVPMGLWAH
jgi:hypothetical protein